MAARPRFRSVQRPSTPTYGRRDDDFADSSQMYGGQGSRPVPDPTILTTQLIDRAIAGLRELLEANMDGNHSELLARLGAMDQAIVLLQAARDKNPAEIDAKLAQLLSLIGERFSTLEERFKTMDVQFGGIALQFRERDTRSERESRDNKVAVDAAFAAQKEAASEQNKSNTLAIDKSEKATAETLNKQADLFTSRTDALIDQHDDLKERVTRIESFGIGTTAAVATRQADRGFNAYMAFGVIGVIVGAIGIMLAILKL